MAGEGGSNPSFLEPVLLPVQLLSQIQGQASGLSLMEGTLGPGWGRFHGCSLTADKQVGHFSSQGQWSQWGESLSYLWPSRQRETLTGQNLGEGALWEFLGN